MNLTFIKKPNRWQPISLEEVNEFEALIGMLLPEDYKAFMLEHNGGYIENLRHVNYPNGEQGLARLFSIKYGSGFTMEKMFLSNVERIPKGTLVIGGTNYGGKIIISLNDDETYGTTLEWLDEDGKYNYLSPSFTQLLNDQVEEIG